MQFQLNQVYPSYLQSVHALRASSIGNIYNNKTEHMQKTKTSTKIQPVPPPSSFHHHIIGLTRSLLLECFLYTSCSSKDQNSEANRKKARKETCGSDLSPLPHDTTDTDANAATLHQQAPLPSLQKDIGATTAHRGYSATAAASLTGIDLFPLEGGISSIGQPVGHPHREYNTITTPKTCQYNQASSAMVKTMHSFLWVSGSTPRH